MAFCVLAYFVKIRKKLQNRYNSLSACVSKVRGNYVDAELLDTYDFNKNEKNPLVKMGCSVQETGKLTHTI